MSDNPVIGSVVGIDGLRVTVMLNDNSNASTYHKYGKIYRGINVGGFIGIISNARTIVMRIEKEYIEDTQNEPDKQEFYPGRFVRKIEGSIIGHFYFKELIFGFRSIPFSYGSCCIVGAIRNYFYPHWSNLQK